MDKSIILPQCVTLSGVGHFGSNSSLQRLRFKIQPSPGMVSTRQSLVGSELVCSQPWSFQADTQYKLVSSSNSLKVCEKYEKKSAIVKRKRKIQYKLSTHTKLQSSQCLKITEKVAFNIASEASYVYIFSRQKFVKDAKNRKFGEV